MIVRRVQLCGGGMFNPGFRKWRSVLHTLSARRILRDLAASVASKFASESNVVCDQIR